ncbi:hypothetical protein I7I50_06871 [Histoplasma capsulatum G186AR]|uniref:Uncharacterized protein n=1 Tax=Ajellomyces capsulatus TaxID=5037 RepID=A0A8H7YWA9_AJECA|nr:hypothetical protein I7I52_10055 [Histoplasma capsulatum]QSS67710.1 hypothetical protein I7I50_06871 [Histoplasma capsulatum G186AR]
MIGETQAWQSCLIWAGRRCLMLPMVMFTLVAHRTACCTWSFQRNSLSNTTPRRFVAEDGSMAVLSITSRPLPCSLFRRVMWISSVFSAAKREPVRRAHSSIRGMSSSWIFLMFSSADFPIRHRK